MTSPAPPSDIEAQSINALRLESDLIYFLDTQKTSLPGKKATSVRSLQVTRDPLSEWAESKPARKSVPKLLEADERVREARPKSAKEACRKTAFSGFSFRTVSSPERHPKAAQKPLQCCSVKRLLDSQQRGSRPQTAKQTMMKSLQAAEWFSPSRDAFSYLVRLRTSLQARPQNSPQKNERRKSPVISFSRLDFKPLQGNMQRVSNDLRSPFRVTSDLFGRGKKRNSPMLRIEELL